MRPELIPAANRIGQDMGKEIAKGITSNLNFGDILAKSSVKGMPAVRAAAAAVGKEFAKQVADQLDFGQMVTLKTAKGMAATRTAGMAAGREYGKAFARGFELETRHLTKPKV